MGRRLDDLVVRTVPSVRNAVRWNSPFYGVEGEGWFLSYHIFTRYVKMTSAGPVVIDLGRLRQISGRARGSLV